MQRSHTKNALIGDAAISISDRAISFVIGFSSGPLLLADGVHLAQDDSEAAAKLFHVFQLVLLHALLESLLLQDDVGELLLAADAHAQLRVHVLLAIKLLRAEDCGHDVEHSAVHLLRVLADGALGQVVRVEPHETAVGAVLPEALDDELQLGQALELGGEPGARQEPEIGRFGLLTGHAAHGGTQLIVRHCNKRRIEN
jgi:hypothetical protein